MIRLAAPWVLLATPIVAALLILAAPRKARVRGIMRVGAGLLLVLAIADPLVSEPRTSNNVLFVVDRSASVVRTSDLRASEDAMRRIASEHPSWSYGIVEFASSARVVAPLGAREFNLPASPPPGEETNLQAGIELALSLLPKDGPNQIVVLSDGRAGDLVAKAALAARNAGTLLSCVGIGANAPSDVQLAAISAPGESTTGRPFSIQVKVLASSTARATLALYRGSKLIAHREVDLAPGLSSHAFVDTLDQPGLYEFRAVVKRDGDILPENDARSALVRTSDHPSVLLVDGTGRSAIPQLLEAVGVPYVQAETVPSFSGLADFRQVILSETSLTDLTAQASTRLEQFVANLGGGLLVVHGESQVRGFGGGPIESLLPVAYDIPETEREPSLAIVYLLDRSGSMTELVGPKTKIRILREAAAASVLLLPPETLVGIIAFSDRYEWTVPLAPLGDATGAFAAIQGIAAVGGTDIYYPLADAIDRVAFSNARVKHILLVSDGKTATAGRDYPGLLAEIASRGDLTVSVIAVSRNPNLAFLDSLVRAGRGDLYLVDDFLNLPQVTMDVTQRLSRSRFITGDVDVTSALGDVTPSPPNVSGYVLTHPRASSTTLLWAGRDPLFTTWRVGLGSVSVLNTDLAGDWTAQWLAWPELPTLFAALLKTTEPLLETASGAFASVDLQGGTARLALDARNPNGEFAEFLRFTGQLLPGEEELEISQVAPGLYESTFARPAEGGYAILARDLTSGRSTIAPFSVPFSDEYAATGPDTEALAEMASFTGGAVLGGGTLLPVATARSTASRRLAPALIGAALALFLLDLALSRRSRTGVTPETHSESTSAN